MGRSAQHRTRTRAGTSTSLGTAIGMIAEDLGISGLLKQYSVITGWPGLVGEQIAKVTTPLRIDNGILFVSVSTAPWRAELTMRRREILGMIERAYGRGLVTDIRFR